MMVEGSEAGRAGLVTPAMKRSASLIALSRERQGYEPLPGGVRRRIED